MTNTIKELFFSHDKNIVHKWTHYLDIYEKWFSSYKNIDIKLLEIGVSMGGSLQLWQKYFNSNSIIVGLDINPACKVMEKDNISIIIGSQDDSKLLNNIPHSFDIIIDDGSHVQSHIITSFENLWEKLNFGGIYLIEDLHTSYWEEFGGGLNSKTSVIEYFKNILDFLNGHHVRDKTFINKWTQQIGGIHFYDSIIVIEKNKNELPYHSKKGNIII